MWNQSETEEESQKDLSHMWDIRVLQKRISTPPMVLELVLCTVGSRPLGWGNGYTGMPVQCREGMPQGQVELGRETRDSD